MNGADFGDGQHSDGQFNHAPHVDGDGVALLHAQAFQHIGKAVDLFGQLGVAVGAGLAIFTFPDDGSFVLAAILHMAIQRVVNHIGLAADKPLEKGRATAVNHLSIGRIPVDQLLGARIPEGHRISQRGLTHR